MSGKTGNYRRSGLWASNVMFITEEAVGDA
jgi:hypothetical protein